MPSINYYKTDDGILFRRVDTDLAVFYSYASRRAGEWIEDGALTELFAEGRVIDIPYSEAMTMLQERGVASDDLDSEPSA